VYTFCRFFRVAFYWRLFFFHPRYLPKTSIEYAEDVGERLSSSFVNSERGLIRPEISEQNALASVYSDAPPVTMDRRSNFLDIFGSPWLIFERKFASFRNDKTVRLAAGASFMRLPKRDDLFSLTETLRRRVVLETIKLVAIIVIEIRENRYISKRMYFTENNSGKTFRRKYPRARRRECV